MQKVLITGGTGFIGSNLISFLLKKRNYKIRLFLRKESNTFRIKDFLNKIEIKVGNFYNKKDLAEAIKGVDIVFHLASVLGMGKKEDYEKFNIGVSKNIFELSIKYKIKKVIYLSSLAVMGGSDKPHIYSEDDIPEPKTLYGWSKYEVEKIAMNLYKKKGFNITILRPPSVYGENDNFDRGFIRIIDLIARNKFIPIGKMNNLMSLIYIKNLVDAMFIVLKNSEKSRGKIYFVSDKEILTAYESYKLILKYTAGKEPFFHLPQNLMLFIDNLIEKSFRFLHIPPFYPQNFVHDLTTNYACSIKKIRSELNWTPPYSLEEGLKNTIVWYKSVRNGK